jgi:hypothetical protein
MDETRSGVWVKARRGRRTLDSRVVGRPFRVHILQFLEGVDGLGDGTTECSTVLVVLELVYMTGDGASFVVGCRVCQKFCIHV